MQLVGGALCAEDLECTESEAMGGAEERHVLLANDSVCSGGTLTSIKSFWWTYAAKRTYAATSARYVLLANNSVCSGRTLDVNQSICGGLMLPKGLMLPMGLARSKAMAPQGF